jgi:alanyl-tRNA synthetase
MTEHLYYTDSYLTEFDARVVEIGQDNRVYLDRSAFYPVSGGQPFDRGSLAGVTVEEVVEEEDGRIAHRLTDSLPKAPGDLVHGVIDWQRRWDHMQQHTGQHLLSAVLLDRFGWPTLSFHMGADYATVELGTPSASDAQLAEAEERANTVVWENRPVSVSFEDAYSGDLGLRKESKREGRLRIVSIEGLDRSACGGTHVRSTAEIGIILLRRTERIRGNLRLEFLCGLRALRRARADYAALTQAARLFSSSIDEVPTLVEAKMAEAAAGEKARRKLMVELAALEGEALYRTAEAGSDGVRRYRYHGPVTDDVRARAQAFTGWERAVFLAVCSDPPSLLYAVSKDLGIHAGQVLKDALSVAGGRGGGSATLAQGSVADRTLLDAIVAKLETLGPKQ